MRREVTFARFVSVLAILLPHHIWHRLYSPAFRRPLIHHENIYSSYMFLFDKSSVAARAEEQV